MKLAKFAISAKLVGSARQREARFALRKISRTREASVTRGLPGMVDRVYPRIDTRHRLGEYGRQHCRQWGERLVGTHIHTHTRKMYER